MIYGYKFMPDASTTSEKMFGFNSVAYNELCNRREMLSAVNESAVDETEKIKLEAQIAVLNEVAAKDIINKIIEFFKKLKENIEKFINKIRSKVKGKIISPKAKKVKKKNETDEDMVIVKTVTIKYNGSEYDVDELGDLFDQVRDHELGLNDELFKIVGPDNITSRYDKEKLDQQFINYTNKYNNYPSGKIEITYTTETVPAKKHNQAAIDIKYEKASAAVLKELQESRKHVDDIISFLKGKAVDMGTISKSETLGLRWYDKNWEDGIFSLIATVQKKYDNYRLFVEKAFSDLIIKSKTPGEEDLKKDFSIDLKKLEAPLP